MTNPLLSNWSTAFEMPPFTEINDSDFAPAITTALTQARENINTIANNPDAPSFENTIDALEQADALLSRVLGVFYNLAGADSTPKREALQRDFAPLLATYSSEITLNPALFARIDTLWQTRETLGLRDEQMRVLMLTRRSFVRSGALLEGAARDRLRDIMKRLAILGTRFMQNLLEDERNWFMALDTDALNQLPDFVVDAAIAAGTEKGLQGPVITLSRSLITPFLQFSPNRTLRQRAYEAYCARGANSGATDNRAIAHETLALRQERAQLLGYDTFASFKLETEMAKTPKNVRDLLMQVWKPARSAAMADADALTQLLHLDGIDGPIQPWDWHFYSNQRRQTLHDLDEASLKPYLQLNRMIDAVFDTANRLFGLEFTPLETPLYHKDARAWEVTRAGQHMAVFIGDYFARGSKRSGAWCSAMRSQQKLSGDIRPIVVNICNFSKPPEGACALLSWDDARTLFHEFGHALHQILSNVTYESISGTSVARDFVELPSQLFEHWLEVPEILETFATHAETDAKMPAEMLEKLLNAATYDMGFQTVEYVASALVDLAFHDGPAPADPMQKQAEILEEIGMPSAIRMRHATPHFAHIFTGDGYSSGYYSYMWSEVMDADAFAAFEEKGDAFDPNLAASLEANILSQGGILEADILYKAFRGRLPGVTALLKGRGLT